MPDTVQWSDEDIGQLELGDKELRMFKECGSLKQCICKPNKPMPTALHGWGNQLTACPCGCREMPLAEHRLRDRGLTGMLIPLGGTTSCAGEELPRLRHIHPEELALLQGVVFPREWSGNLRLGLAGLGLVASPLQAAWVMSQIIEHVKALEWIEQRTQLPEEVMWDQIGVLIANRNGMVSPKNALKGNCNLLNRIRRALQQSWAARKGPHSVRELDMCEESSEERHLRQIEEPTRTKRGPEGTEAIQGADIQKTEQGGNGAALMPLSKRLKVDQLVSKYGGLEAFANPEHPSNAEQTEKTEEAQQSPELQSQNSEPIETPTPQTEEKTRETETRDRQSECQQSASAVNTVRDQIERQTEDEETPQLQGAITSGKTSAPSETRPEKVTINLVGSAGDYLRLVAQGNSTVGDVLDAQSATTGDPKTSLAFGALGDILHHGEQLRQDMWIIAAEHRDQRATRQPNERETQSQETKHRAAQVPVHRQWVAIDEMQYMLQQFADEEGARPAEVLAIAHTEETQSKIREWLRHPEGQRQDGEPFIGAILHQDHWIPVFSEGLGQAEYTVCTTQPGQELLREAGCPQQIATVTMHTEFHGDCGYQTIAMLKAMSMPHKETGRYTRRQAMQSRERFLTTEEAHGEGPRLRAGGAGPKSTESPQDFLRDLLRQHGVFADRLEQRCQTITKAIRPQDIASLAQSTRPWHDLKQHANMSVPRIQLILSDELQAQIEKRAGQGGQLGRKKNKESHQDHIRNMNMEVQAADLFVPPGVYQLTTGDIVPQISLKELRADTSGVILASETEATAVLRRPRPLTSGGVALIIIGQVADTIGAAAKEIRFPATFKPTGEPILTTGWLLQLGAVTVQRAVPTASLGVELVPTQCIRAVIYRDQTDEEWAEIAAHPVRHLFAASAALKHASQKE